LVGCSAKLDFDDWRRFPANTRRSCAGYFVRHRILLAICTLDWASLELGTVDARRDDNVTARARIHVYLRQARPKIASVSVEAAMTSRAPAPAAWNRTPCGWQSDRGLSNITKRLAEWLIHLVHARWAKAAR
jgi:hypothetical protein